MKYLLDKELWQEFDRIPSGIAGRGREYALICRTKNVFDRSMAHEWFIVILKRTFWKKTDIVSRFEFQIIGFDFCSKLSI